VFVDLVRNVIVLEETVLAKMLQSPNQLLRRKILGKNFQDVPIQKPMLKVSVCVTDLRDVTRDNASVIPSFHHALRLLNPLEKIFCVTAK
jgi:hypothetical protein